MKTYSHYTLKDLPKHYSVEKRGDGKFILTSPSGTKYIASSINDAVATAVLNERH